MVNDKDKLPADFNPHREARKLDEAARSADRKRQEAIARAQPTRGPIPPVAKGRTRYVASADTVSPDGKHRRAGEVFSVPAKTEPSVTWDNYEDRLKRTKGA